MIKYLLIGIVLVGLSACSNRREVISENAVTQPTVESLPTCNRTISNLAVSWKDRAYLCTHQRFKPSSLKSSKEIIKQPKPVVTRQKHKTLSQRYSHPVSFSLEDFVSSSSPKRSDLSVRISIPFYRLNTTLGPLGRKRTLAQLPRIKSSRRVYMQGIVSNRYHVSYKQHHEISLGRALSVMRLVQRKTGFPRSRFTILRPQSRFFYSSVPRYGNVVEIRYDV